MAQDLILGKTRRSWARGSVPTTLAIASVVVTDEVTFRMTPAEAAALADLAETKMRADAGDRSARKKMASYAKKIVSLQKKARRGDASAARTLRVLAESGVFRGAQAITMGADLVSNLDYRKAVYRQAMRNAGNKRPTTRDFARAKSAVDGTMERLGIALYLPGARPGRLTI